MSNFKPSFITFVAVLLILFPFLYLREYTFENSLVEIQTDSNELLRTTRTHILALVERLYSINNSSQSSLSKHFDEYQVSVQKLISETEDRLTAKIEAIGGMILRLDVCGARISTAP